MNKRQQTRTVQIYRSSLTKRLAVAIIHFDEGGKPAIDRTYHNLTKASRERLEDWLQAHRDGIVVRLGAYEPYIIYGPFGQGVK